MCPGCFLVWSSGPCPECHGGGSGDRELLTGYTAGPQGQDREVAEAEGTVSDDKGDGGDGGGSDDDAGPRGEESEGEGERDEVEMQAEIDARVRAITNE